ncbi:hypothetical protein LTS15_009733 [Exophiala xenobiotica]|nr:hypothetical protein LTS15_009733 [Exophiala xenobiotica]
MKPRILGWPTSFWLLDPFGRCFAFHSAITLEEGQNNAENQDRMRLRPVQHRGSATFAFFKRQRSQARRVRRLVPSPPFVVAPDFVLDILQPKGAKTCFSTTVVKKTVSQMFGVIVSARSTGYCLVWTT